MLRSMMLLAAGASVLGLSAAASAAPVTYVGSQQIGSILAKYTIVTDGKTGSLTDADVTAFNVSLSDAISTVSYGRTAAGGTGSDNGYFAATATALTIPAFLSLNLYANSFGPSGGVLGYLSFRDSTSYAQMDDAAHGAGLVQTAPISNRTLPFATLALTAAVPEAASWAMMMVGMGLVGGALRRRPAAKARVRFA